MAFARHSWIRVMFYFTISAIKAEAAKRMPRTIVALKSTFSNPLLVWKAELKLSPKAPPKPAPVCCKSTATIRRTDKAIWIYGRNGRMNCIWGIIAGIHKKANTFNYFLNNVSLWPDENDYIFVENSVLQRIRSSTIFDIWNAKKLVQCQMSSRFATPQ